MDFQLRSKVTHLNAKNVRERFIFITNDGVYQNFHNSLVLFSDIKINCNYM